METAACFISFMLGVLVTMSFLRWAEDRTS